MKKMFRRTLGVAAMLAAGATLGTASTISYWVDVFSAITTAQLCSGTCPDHTTATFDTGSGAHNVSLTIPKFDQTDPNPGHVYELTSVAIAIDWKATGTVTLFNFFNSNLTFDHAQSSTLMTLTADGTQVVANGAAGAGPGVAICCTISNGPTLFIGSTTFEGLTGSGSNSQIAPNLGFFQGFGSNSFTSSLHTDAVAVTGSSTDPNANPATLAYSGSGNMGAIATFTYTYAEVAAPEPLTFALVGSSLIGLGLIMRRKRSNKA